MDGDPELAAGRLVDVVGELLDILGVEVRRRIRRRHVPLRLCGGRRGDRGENGGGDYLQHFHEAPLQFGKMMP